jgi:GDPmannose 4,6-dehydratase
MKKAFITGITGQDGSYLSRFLLNKGYEVHGMVRRTSLINTSRIDDLFYNNEIKDRFFLHHGDMLDTLSINSLIKKIQPDEVYNLAAQSHVGVSFSQPDYTANIDGLGTLRILESVRQNDLESHTKIYQASTSELFGLVQETPQTENTPFYPRSPYGVAKMYAYWITVNYREAYKMFACNGILFNHESPVRGETFVTRKITRGLTRMFCGIDRRPLLIGNLDAMRDWGHAKDYIQMQWLMLQQNEPEDYVIATGKQHSIREFITWACNDLGIDIEFTGEGLDEIGVIKSIEEDNTFLSKGDTIIEVSKKYFRPTEVESLLGDASKAKKNLGWEPKFTAREMCAEMIEADLKESKFNANK